MSVDKTYEYIKLFFNLVQILRVGCHMRNNGIGEI